MYVCLQITHFIVCLFRYSEMANNVQKEDTLVNKDFVLLDCSPIKVAIMAHCDEWQSRFYKLLLEMASKKLFAITAFLKDKEARSVVHTHHIHTCTLTTSIPAC